MNPVEFPEEVNPVEFLMKQRLDKELVQRGLAPTREKAQGLILAGRVSVDGRIQDKPGAALAPGAVIEVRAPASRFVGRGGEKIEGAHQVFGFPIAGRACLDCGISTGGFTHYLLENGAAQVTGVDVGYGQVADEIRRDPRVKLLERVNIRHLTPADLPVRPQLFTFDLSFITLRTALEKALELGADEMQIVGLVKPQFEVGKAHVGKGGVVRSPERVVEVLRDFHHWAETHGLDVRGLTPSPHKGKKSGNQEYFLWLSRPALGPPYHLTAENYLAGTRLEKPGHT